MIKWSIYQKDITIINICTWQQSYKVHEAISDRIKGIDNSTIIGNFNTPLLNIIRELGRRRKRK